MEPELSPEQIQNAIRKKWREDKATYRAKKKLASITSTGVQCSEAKKE